MAFRAKGKILSPGRAASYPMIALAGTPNSGKTTLFNRITGFRHKVANYPGVTVEKRSAVIRLDGREVEIVDLPGMYGLGGGSLDEQVARDFCIQERPDLIVAVLDASNLERGLYLVIQWLELGFPVVVALNMYDEAEAQGLRIDADALAELLGMPVVPTVASKGVGVERLEKAIVGLLDGARRARPFETPLDPPVEEEARKIAELLARREGSRCPCPPRWTATKLIEGDRAIAEQVGLDGDEELADQVRRSIERLESLYDRPLRLILTGCRYDFSRHLLGEVVTRVHPPPKTLTDRIDRIAANPYLGLPLFLLATYAVFEFAFTLGKPPMDWIEAAVGWLSALAARVLPEGTLRSLVIEGILGGVGGVLVFLPSVLLLFLAMAFMEDSGYMARGAAVMDRFLSKIGLHGKSFIPLMIGFGCNVPAIMAARVLENRRDRLVTILIMPMMSCGARLPVYVLFISAFFAHGAPVLFSIYLLGILMAVFSAVIFRRFVFRGRSTPFILEMPPYRLPTLRTVVLHAWDRAWMYLKKAGTVILLLSVVIWVLSTYPRPPRGIAMTRGEALRYSVAGTVGTFLEPVLRPIGLGDWKVGVALVSGFAAKEVVVSTFATLYNVSGESERSAALRTALQDDPFWDPLKAYALMLFTLLYIPCLPAMVVLARESGSWKWAVFQVAYTTLLAYTVALIAYQGGRLLGLGS